MTWNGLILTLVINSVCLLILSVTILIYLKRLQDDNRKSHEQLVKERMRHDIMDQVVEKKKDI